MTYQLPLPSRLLWLGEALRPVLRKLEVALAEPRLPTAPVSSMRQTVTEGRDALDATNTRLKAAVNGLMSGVVAREEVSEHEVYRAAWRVEVVLDVLMERYGKICRYCAKGRDEEACLLLMGLFRHSMRETHGWLQELVDTLTNPRAALLRKGLPTTGRVRITLPLTLSSAPEAEQLQRWLEEGAKPLSVATPAPVAASVPVPARSELPAFFAPMPRPAPAPRPMPVSRKQGVDFFDLLIAGVIGWGVGNALFGDD